MHVYAPRSELCRAAGGMDRLVKATDHVTERIIRPIENQSGPNEVRGFMAGNHRNLETLEKSGVTLQAVDRRVKLPMAEGHRQGRVRAKRGIRFRGPVNVNQIWETAMNHVDITKHV